MFKKIISLYVATHLLATTLVPFVSSVNGTNLFAAGNIISEVCVDKSSEEFLPITDEKGTTVLTKKEFNRDCTLTKEVQGACKKWESISENYAVDPDEKVAYRSENHSGALGEMLAMISAYDQLEHLWSGWKGYCEIGTKTNFDWASDPAFWAGLVASTLMDGSAKGTTTKIPGTDTTIKGSDGFLSGTGFGKGIQGMESGLTAGMKGYAGPLTSYIGESAGKCLIASGFDVGKVLLSSATEQESDDMCNSVDEFCGDELTQTEESDIMTIDKQQYDDMIAEHPEYAEYMIIVGEENGVLSVRYKNVNELEGITEADMAKLDEMKKKLKEMQLIISASMTAIKLGACIGTDGGVGSSADGSYANSDKPMFSMQNGLSMAVGMIPAQYLGPYGALIKAALQILINFLYSFQDIDSCHDQEDADMQGSRHAKTCEALPYKLCHFIYSKCVDNCGDNFLGLAKELVGYNYCCYDQILTKTLVVQLKAQLGRDWSNCTGISLRDLNFVSFRQCSAREKASGKDGGKENVGLDYDPFETFQFKNKCIDLTEFKNYLKAQIGDDIDLEDFDSVFTDIKTQNK